MTLYEPSTHEPLLVAWFYGLKEDPREFENLFATSLRRLGPLLHWAEHQVKIMYELGDDGMIAMAAWVSPLLDGAEFGSWVRKDYRGSVKSVLFIRKCYRTAFETFPVLVGITRQPELHDLHLALGYEYVGEIEQLFDGASARVYKLRREVYLVGRRIKIERKRQQHDQQPAGEYAESIREVGAANSEATQQPDRGSAANGRGERGDSDSQPQPRRRKKRLLNFLSEHLAGTSA